jgi:hypothetical protein
MSSNILDTILEEQEGKYDVMPVNPTFFWKEEDIYKARHPGKKSVALIALRVRSRGKPQGHSVVIRVGEGILFRPEHIGTAGPFPAMISEITV